MHKTSVKTKVSHRGGQAVACDLLRVVCRIRAREVREAMRARLDAFSAGYLVSDYQEEVWRDDGGRVVVLSSGVQPVYGLRYVDEVRCMDAPYWLPAGSVYRHRVDSLGSFCAADRRFFRDGWYK